MAFYIQHMREIVLMNVLQKHNWGN